MNSSPPPYTPSPPSDTLPPIPSITGVQPVAPPLQFTIRAPAAPTMTAMPQVSAPATYQTPVPTTQYRNPIPGQTVQYQAPTTTLRLQPQAIPVPGMISAPQVGLQNQKLRLSFLDNVLISVLLLL